MMSMHASFINKCCSLVGKISKLLVLIMLTQFGIMQVRVYDLASMSCHYVLSGHTETILCIDTCVSSSGRSLIVTGSKDKSVSFIFFDCL